MIEDCFPLRARSTKWHFFPENEALKKVGKRKVVGLELNNVDPTSEALCQDRVSQLEGECLVGPSKKLFRLMGRVLHHVQDMSTPAHVVPVYHEPFSPDSYEHYSVKHTAERLSSLGVTPDRFSELRGELGDSFDLYVKGAHATLDYLYEQGTCFSRSVDGKQEEVTCDEFWLWCRDRGFHGAAKGGEGFGCYGVLGRHFGKTRFEAGGRVYEVEADVFERLHRHLVHKAVDDSLKVFMFAEARLAAS